VFSCSPHVELCLNFVYENKENIRSTNANTNANPTHSRVLGVKVKVKQSWTGPEGSRRLSSNISRQSAHEGGKVVSPTHRPHLPPGNIPGTHFC
jgi:hypothetical protein